MFIINVIKYIFSYRVCAFYVSRNPSLLCIYKDVLPYFLLKSIVFIILSLNYLDWFFYVDNPSLSSYLPLLAPLTYNATFIIYDPISVSLLIKWVWTGMYYLLKEDFPDWVATPLLPFCFTTFPPPHFASYYNDLFSSLYLSLLWNYFYYVFMFIFCLSY